MKDKVRDMVQQAASNVTDSTQQSFEESFGAGVTELEGMIQDRMQRVVSRARVKESLDKFAGINEEEILTFVPDKRSLSGIGTMILGLLFLVLLPGAAKVLALFFFLLGGVIFALGYGRNAKVDVPEGFEGVVCRFGEPLTRAEGKASRGRNWCFNYARFIPYLVSQRDQVVDMTNANFTWDFGSICLSKQVVFRIEDPGKFISKTSPAGIMKMLNLYASYIALRMITSMRDARVKFVGRDRIDNVVQALNGYLAEPYGIRVARASMPSAENDIIDDLEKIRTQLKSIEALSDDKQVKLESAIKEVESRMRKARKETRSKALELQHAKIAMETGITEEVNTKRQAMLIDARKQLEEKISRLKREIASVRARLEKAKAIQASFRGIEAQLDLRKAALKRRIFQKMMPAQVEVLGVQGIGPGVGMSVGGQLFRALQSGAQRVSAKVRRGGDGETGPVDEG